MKRFALIFLALPPLLGVGCFLDDDNEVACVSQMRNSPLIMCRRLALDNCQEATCSFGLDGEWCAYYDGLGCEDLGLAERSDERWSPPDDAEPIWETGFFTGGVPGGSGDPPSRPPDEDPGGGGTSDCNAAWTCDPAPQNASFCMQACAYDAAGRSSEAQQICGTLKNLAGGSASGCCPTCGL